ncbi:MAG: glycosyltransferase [Candidatus Saccharimonadales bacterium]
MINQSTNPPITNSPLRSPRVVIVCDFLTTMGGAENVVLAMHEAFPNAPIYTAMYNKDKMPQFAELDIRTSSLQRLPRIVRKYHKMFPTRAVKAMRKLDLDEFDIILTSSYLHGHQVTKSRSEQVIINYCHTPPRYYWSHYEEYRRDPGYGKLNPIIRKLMPIMVPKQRKKDLEAAKNVDVFIANSTETQRRIEKYYRKKSIIIHPPVDTKRFSPKKERGEHYVTIGRQLPYKRYDIAVEAANALKLKLIVFGDGPMHEKLVAMAGPTIEFRNHRFGNASDEEYEKAITTAKGFIYPAEEDFGIVTVEALAAGTPVIGLGKAGTLDIVEDEVSGTLFDEQAVYSVMCAIQKAQKTKFSPAILQRKAKRFDKTLFISKIRKVVGDYSS